MKAVILAAGKGERLKDVTKKIPKPMIEFKNKPILEYNIELCKKYGIDEIFINTSHLAEVITNYFGDGSNLGISINYSYEKELLGTSGALNNFKKFLLDEPFFVIYGDNLANFDLGALIQKFAKENAIGVIGCHYREDITNSGVVVTDENNRILKFVEKPKDSSITSRWVNAGYYFLSPMIFDYIPKGISDFSYDIFPKLILAKKPLYAVTSEVDLRQFDTIDMLKNSLNR